MRATGRRVAEPPSSSNPTYCQCAYTERSWTCSWREPFSKRIYFRLVVLDSCGGRVYISHIVIFSSYKFVILVSIVHLINCISFKCTSFYVSFIWAALCQCTVIIMVLAMSPRTMPTHPYVALTLSPKNSYVCARACGGCRRRNFPSWKLPEWQFKCPVTCKLLGSKGGAVVRSHTKS